MSYIQYFIIFLNYNYGAIFHFEFIEYCVLLYIQKVGTNYVKSVNTSLTVYLKINQHLRRDSFFSWHFYPKITHLPKNDTFILKWHISPKVSFKSILKWQP